MSKKPAQGVRARVRAELTAEIKAAATRQLVEVGAAAISLRAIARELGMASSAIYRYFASRDDLLTALIIDAYNDLGDVVESAEGAVADRADLGSRFVAIALSIRTWAVDNPHHYALLYGSPVPGYAAPQDTIDPATRVPVALLSLLVEAGEKQRRTSKKLDLALSGLSEFTGNTLSSPRLSEGVEVWGTVFGYITLELFGHFENAVADPAVVFETLVAGMAERLFA